MTVTYSATEIRGLSADTKPANVPDNSVFYETDTGIYYKKLTGVWTQIATNLSSPPLTSSATATITNKTQDFDSNTFKHTPTSTDYVIDYDSTRTSGTQYKARNSKTGAVIASGSTLDAVIPAVFTAINALTYFGSPDPRGGVLYIGSGTHTFSGSLAGMDIPEMTKVSCAPNCVFVIPNDYSSYVFSMKGLSSGQSSPYQLSTFEGGYFKEAGTSQRLWDGILIQCVAGSAGSISSCTVRDTKFVDALNGVHFQTTDTSGNAYINGCYFFNIAFSDCVNSINFDQNGQPLFNGTTGFTNRNEFYSIVGQSGTHVLYGVKNITGANNLFVGCKIWDVGLAGSGAVTANIVAGAINTQILGGIMTSQNFTDLGKDTFINDDVKGFVKSIQASGLKVKLGAVQMSDIGLESNVVSPIRDGTQSGFTLQQYNNTSFNITFSPFDDTTTITNSYSNRTGSERFYIQKNTTQYLFDFVRQTSGGSLRPALFRMLDVPGATTTESFRIDTDAITKFAKPIDLTTQSSPSNPATGASRIYVKTIDSNNDGVFALIKKAGAFVEVQIL